MKDELLIQYGAIRNTIKNNLETISQLVQQAENLKCIIEKMNGDTGENELKNSLALNIEEIENTIGALIKQTSDLFDQYNKFVEQVFNGTGK